MKRTSSVRLDVEVLRIVDETVAGVFSEDLEAVVFGHVQSLAHSVVDGVADEVFLLRCSADLHGNTYQRHD
jgi:hypothetical protein